MIAVASRGNSELVEFGRSVKVVRLVLSGSFEICATLEGEPGLSAGGGFGIDGDKFPAVGAEFVELRDIRVAG